LRPATAGGDLHVAARLRVGDEQAWPDPEADVAVPELYRIVDVVVPASVEDSARLPAQRRRPPDRPVLRIGICEPVSVGFQARHALQSAQRPGHADASAGERRGDMHPRLPTGPRRFRPTDEVTGQEEGALRVAAVDDHAVTGTQVVHVDHGFAVEPAALYPRRDPVQRVRSAHGTCPEFAAGRSRGGTDPPHPAGTRVPGPDGEVVEARERVILRPDQPAAVESAVRLINGRLGECLDDLDQTRSGVDLRDP